MIAAAARCSVSRSAASSSGSASGSSPPWSPLVQQTSQPSDPASIQRAAVPAGPNSASSGCAATSMKREGRQAWSVATAGSVTGPRRERRGADPSRRARRLELVKGRQDDLGVALCLDLAPDARDAAIGIDQERRPDEAHVGPAVVLLLPPRAVCVGE